MPSKEEKQRRRELTRAIADKQRAEDEARLPFEKEVLQAPIARVEEDVFDEAGADRCNHTLRHTQESLESHGAWSDAARAWLNEHGGYCDCEVVYNVGDWLDGGL